MSETIMARVPWHGWAWLPLGLAAMGFATLHIMLDGGVALFDFTGTLTGFEATMLVGIALIHVWWAVSFLAGTHGRVGGILSAAVLAFGWTTLTNGSAIVYCAPTCPDGYPLTDVAHIGCIVLGPLAGLAALWGAGVQWRSRKAVLWWLPVVALALVPATIVGLANSAT